MNDVIDPIKLCCFRRKSEHHGVVCPDGLVMCCLCFERVEQDALATYEDGFKMDVCQECWDAEQVVIRERR